MTKTKRNSWLRALAAMLALGGAHAAIAQVDYTDPRQRNPGNSREVEKGFQDHQRQHRQRQESDRSSAPQPSRQRSEFDQSSSSDTVRSPPSDEGGRPGRGTDALRPHYHPPVVIPQRPGVVR